MTILWYSRLKGQGSAIHKPRTDEHTGEHTDEHAGEHTDEHTGEHTDEHTQEHTDEHAEDFYKKQNKESI